MTNIWTQNGNRVAALPPGPDDLFVVTTMFGKRVAVQPVGEFGGALSTAEAFANKAAPQRPFTIKVVSMTLPELLASMGMTATEFIEGFTPEDDAEFRRQAVNACMSALRDCNDAGVRAEAWELLSGTGENKQ